MDELLAGDRGAAEVREREITGQRLGISGVPFFVINDAIVLSGAQALEASRAAFEQATAAGVCKACKFDPAPGQRGC